MQSFDNPPDFDFKRDPLETQAERLRRKLAKRDARIAGLERRVAELEHQIAVQHRQTDMLPIELNAKDIALRNLWNVLGPTVPRILEELPLEKSGTAVEWKEALEILKTVMTANTD